MKEEYKNCSRSTVSMEAEDSKYDPTEELDKIGANTTANNNCTEKCVEEALATLVEGLGDMVEYIMKSQLVVHLQIFNINHVIVAIFVSIGFLVSVIFQKSDIGSFALGGSLIILMIVLVSKDGTSAFKFCLLMYYGNISADTGILIVLGYLILMSFPIASFVRYRFNC